MITILLAIDGIAFLAVLAILSIIFIILSAVDEPSPRGSSIILFITLVLAVLFTDIGPMSLAQPWLITLYVFSFFVIGCIYSVFIRWPLYLNGLRRQLIKAKLEILKDGGFASGDLITPSHKFFKKWSIKVYDIGCSSGMHVSDDGKIVPPQYQENKARLLTWAMLWPWNILWVLVRKPIVWIFEELLSLQILKNICQAISNWTFKDFNK
jgi:hypothetical protein